MGGFVNNFPRSFAFRLTLEDGMRLDAAAAAQGTTSGEWARQAISAALAIAYERRSMRRRVANADLLRRLLAELMRQGNNLNQIAARLNAERVIDAAAARQTLEVIGAAQVDLIAAIVAALGGTAQP